MKDYPAIKLSLLFAAGILSERFFSAGYLLPVLLTVILFIHLLPRRIRLSTAVNYVMQVLLILSVISAANLWARSASGTSAFFPEDIYRLKNVNVTGEVSGIHLIGREKLTTELTLLKTNGEKPENLSGVKVICSIRDDPGKLEKLYSGIGIGNIVEVTGTYFKGRDRRNPGEFDYNQYLRARGISGIINIYDVSKFKMLDRRESFLPNLVFNIRRGIDRQIRMIYDSRTSGFLRGILLADRGEISYDTKTDFINSGVIHILAVSGLHVGYILLIFALLFGRLSIYPRAIFTIAGLLVFLLITGVPASAFRATVMAVILILALLLNRSTNLLNSVAIAAIVILIFNPAELFNAGFQLSFSAVISIGVFYPVFRERIKNIGIKNKAVRGLFLFMSVSLAAQIGTLPFTVYYFGKISIAGILANLLVIPAAGMIVGIAILSLVLSVILPAAASYFVIVNEIIVKTIYSVIHFTGGSSLSFFRINNFSVADIVLYIGILILLVHFFKLFQNRSAKAVLSVVCIALFFVLGSIGRVDLIPENELSVMMIDVGQGDSFLVKFPGGKTALIDAGEASYSFDNGERVILPLLNYLGIGKIDYGFISHVDLDHYGGFISLIHNGRIGMLYKPRADSSLKKDVKLEKFIAESNITVRHYRKEILNTGNARIYILNTNEISDWSSNNGSGLLKIVYGNSEYLFTGDLEKRGERYYDEYYGKFLRSDVLKVGHHGSRTSSSLEFLKFVSPRISLISAGIGNKFHHPSGITLLNLEKSGSKIYRTDRSGAVLLRSDGKSIKKIDWRLP